MNIELLGDKNCNRCEMVKSSLTNRNIEFKYILLEELGTETKKEYIKMARDKGIIELPLIFFELELITLDELVSKLKGDN